MGSNARDQLGDEALDPELLPIIQAQRERARIRGSLESLTPVEMRARAAAEFVEWNRDPVSVASVRDFAIDGVAVRLYDPAPDASDGLLIYLHGGGWVIGDLDLEDAALRRMALRSGVRIISVDYRLAPEHAFPAALDDVETVLRWAAADPSEISVDPARIALGGASAGANLALGAVLRLRDGRMPTPAFLLLMYGAYGGGRATRSYELFGDGRFGLPAAALDWFWKVHAGAVSGQLRCYAVPLEADLHGLPPVYLNHAQLDILRDDSIMLAERLRASGVSVEHRAYTGAVHGFTQYAKGCALARQALDDAGDALATALV